VLALGRGGQQPHPACGGGLDLANWSHVEVTLSDGSTNAIAPVAGGETTCYAVADCTALADGDLTLTVRAYNAAGSSPTLDGDDAVKDATAPTITVTEPEDDICVEVPYVLVKGTCHDTDLVSFTINDEETPRTDGAFEKTLFLTDGVWGGDVRDGVMEW